LQHLFLSRISLKILHNGCFVCLWKENFKSISCGNVAFSLFMDVTTLGVTPPSPPYIMRLGELFSTWKQSSQNSSYSLCSLSPHYRGLPSLHVAPAFSPCRGEGTVREYREKVRLSLGRDHQRTWWGRRVRAGSSAPFTSAKERKSIVAPHSLSFHFHFADKRHKKNESQRSPFFNITNVFCLRYTTSFAVRIPSLC